MNLEVEIMSRTGMLNRHVTIQKRWQFITLSDADATASYQTKHDLPEFTEPHGPLIHTEGDSAHDIFIFTVDNRNFRSPDS